MGKDLKKDLERTSVNESERKVEYNIGLDIGTHSVGWAVTDSVTGELLKFKGKNMLGSRIFEEGQTAQGRRVKRSLRRRYNRRRERIELLRQLMQEDVLSKDAEFFRRLDEGFLYLEDKTVKTKCILFNDESYTDVDYYNEYKTIYHLRAELYETTEKKDIRLVYLALHNLIKYRGHFLYQGQKFSEINGSLKDLFGALYDELTEKCDYECRYQEELIESVENILKDKEYSRKQKQEAVVEILEGTMDNKLLSEVIKMVLGYTSDFVVIFKEELLDDSGKHIKLSFADSKYEEAEDSIMDKLQEKSTILENAKKIYSWFILQNVLQGEGTIARAMTNKYKKHQEDLALLKRLVRSKLSDKEYIEFFRHEFGADKKYVSNYKNYIAGEKRCNREEFYKAVEKLLQNVDDADKEYILQDIQNETFMPLLNSKDNSAIPYQLTLNEAERIIDNQGKYYPNLLANKDKILSLITFRIPYYVGPMNTSSKFSWIERLSMDKIYPWNFSQIVDEDSTAEEFIRRMTNKCTYLRKEDVIPRYSLLYSRFVLLNELNKIRIKCDGRTKGSGFISYEDKQLIIENVFMKHKTVKEKQLVKYLKSINYQNAGSYEIQGYQKDKEFAASLTSYIDMKNIFGEINSKNYEMIEKIIYWLTVFEEKDIVKRKIKSVYGDRVSKEQLEKICKLRYKGWSRISENLLVGLKAELSDCSRVSVMDILEKTNLNFMQIINDKRYGFDKLIQAENDYNELSEITLQDVENLQGSPAIKRGIWQTVRIINEIVQIMGNDPKNIYIEFARKEQEKERTTSRLNKLKKAYDELKKDVDEYNKSTHDNLKDKKYSDKLNSEKMLLYFMQNGKCMYSGEPLDIDALSSYQVDHIVPQAYIKDDSIENKALVKSELNQYKSDKLLLSAETRKGQYHYWTRLYKAGLIGAKKYNNLLRESISDGERKGFINRQLVETRQISKHVTALLLQRFVDSNIVTIRAELSHNFREKYKLYKSREINDFHHAHDAFLAAEIGSFLMKRFPGMQSELIYDEFTKYYKSGDKTSFLKEKWGYVLSLLDKEYVTEYGEVIWEGHKNIAYIKSVLYGSDCRVTKKLEELTGEFYNETVYRKDSDKKDMRQRKKNLPANKYGGYSGKNMAYYIVVQFIKGKKSVKKLLGIPVYVNALAKTKPESIKKYIEQEIGTTEYTILKERILKNQLVIENGNELYLVAEKEVVNAKQFFFGEKYVECYKVLLKALSRRVSEEEKQEIETKLCEVYDYIISKTQKQYKLYADVFLKINNAVRFSDLSYDDKLSCISEMLKLLRANSERASMAKYNGENIDVSNKLTDDMGRKRHKLDIDNTIFVDQSISGLYERRYRI